MGIEPPDESDSLSIVDGGASHEEMAELWSQEGGWPLMLAIRAFNHYDFRTFPGGVANHEVDSARELVDRLIELGSERPDAPYPLMFRLELRRVGEDARDCVFLSELCMIESLSELRTAYARATDRAARRFA
jgi:hypothetical protein